MYSDSVDLLIMHPGKILSYIFFISLFFCAVSFFQKNNFPPPSEILSELFSEPRQIKTRAAPFSVEKNGIIYKITPLYDYELHGMVVSYHLASSWWDYYHGEWKDFLNIKDLGFMWGNNLKNWVYKDMKFKSGSWTLYWNVCNSSEKARLSFREDEVSNNHLIAADSGVSRAIMAAQKGDQVYMRGYLASYSHGEGTFVRGSSISRTDTGNHACETVFVKEFKILKEANVFWKLLFKVSGLIALGSLIFWFALYYYKLPG